MSEKRPGSQSPEGAAAPKRSRDESHCQSLRQQHVDALFAGLSTANLGDWNLRECHEYGCTCRHHVSHRAGAAHCDTCGHAATSHKLHRSRLPSVHSLACAAELILRARVAAIQLSAFAWCQSLLEESWAEITGGGQGGGIGGSVSASSKGNKKKRKKKKSRKHRDGAASSTVAEHMVELFEAAGLCVQRLVKSSRSQDEANGTPARPLDHSSSWHLLQTVASLDDFYYRVYYDDLTERAAVVGAGGSCDQNPVGDPLWYVAAAVRATAQSSWLLRDDKGITAATAVGMCAGVEDLLPGSAVIRAYVTKHVADDKNAVSILKDWQLTHVADKLEKWTRSSSGAVGKDDGTSNPLLRLYQLLWAESVLLLGGHDDGDDFVSGAFADVLKAKKVDSGKVYRSKTTSPLVGSVSSSTVCSCCLQGPAQLRACSHCASLHCEACSGRCSKCPRDAPKILCALCAQGDPANSDSPARLCPSCADPVCPPALASYRESRRGWAARLYSYAVPCREALEAIEACSGSAGVVEVGAGTGYWAAMLRSRGVRVAAFDICPAPLCTRLRRGVGGDGRGEVGRKSSSGHHMGLGGGGGHNEYHGSVPSFTAVRKGGPEVLSHSPANSGRVDPPVLFLCYPPPDNDMAERCLKHYRGNTVVYVGEWRGLTATRGFERSLQDGFNLMRRVRLPNWGSSANELTIWSRCDGASGGGGGAAVDGHDDDNDDSEDDSPAEVKEMLNCASCGADSTTALFRCRICRDSERIYCSPACSQHDATAHRAAHTIRFVLLPKSAPGIMVRL